MHVRGCLCLLLPHALMYCRTAFAHRQPALMHHTNSHPLVCPSAAMAGERMRRPAPTRASTGHHSMATVMRSAGTATATTTGAVQGGVNGVCRGAEAPATTTGAVQGGVNTLTALAAAAPSDVAGYWVESMGVRGQAWPWCPWLTGGKVCRGNCNCNYNRCSAGCQVVLTAAEKRIVF